MKTNIVSASSLIIQDETEFRPIISCQNVWGVARLGKWILWGPRTKSLRTTVLVEARPVELPMVTLQILYDTTMDMGQDGFVNMLEHATTRFFQL